MAEQTVTLQPGESKPVSFEAIPREAKVYQVSVDGLTGSFKALRPALTLSFTNPKRSDTVMWDAWLYDINTHSWDKKTIRALSEPCVFHPTGNTFLLCIGEWWKGVRYGPYLVTVPELGQYVWNGYAEKIDGIATTNLPETRNRCFITGMLQEATWENQARISLEEAQDVSGYENIGKYFVGDTIETYGGIPICEGVLIKAGRRVQAYLSMEWYGNQYRWRTSGFRYYPEYPPEAYKFEFSKRREEVPSGMVPKPRRFVYTVTGGVPPFAVIALIRDGTDSNCYKYIMSTFRTTGPVSEFAGPACSGEGCYYECWAHPDPKKSLPPDPRVAMLENWKRLHAGGGGF